MNLTAERITRATGGWVEELGAAVATGVSVDTRTIREGDLFFALEGPSFDGHDFVKSATESGAAGLVLREKKPLPKAAISPAAVARGLFVIRVPDTLAALGDLAGDLRRSYGGKVVVVTGSNGKTTTKEMTVSVLARRWNTAKSPGNFNNLVGVPLSIFGAGENAEAMVLEAGMSGHGEIARITDLADPDVGIITSIAPAHLESLKNMNGIKGAKGELLLRMKTTAVAVLNADDPNVMSLSPTFKGRIITFGVRPGADVWAERMVSRVGGGAAFDLVCREGRTRVRLSFLGLHNIHNALAAAAAAQALDFPLDDVRQGLEACRPLPMRLEQINLPGGVEIINDAYNANPGSVMAAIEAFLTLVTRGRRFVVLGDMLELGEHSAKAHRDIGECIARERIDALVTMGRDSIEASRGFGEIAGAGRWTEHAPGHERVAEILLEVLKPGDLVLVKGSRGMNMEKVVQAVTERMAASAREGN